MNTTRNTLLAILFCLLSTAAIAGPVNINTADAETLAAELIGVGLSRAQAIIEYREAVGPYRSPDDLLPTVAESRAPGDRVLEATCDISRPASRADHEGPPGPEATSSPIAPSWCSSVRGID